jgi:hypothetical protein
MERAMNNSKKVFIYSIQHTGTHFVRDLIEKSAPENKIIRTARYDNLRAIERENRTIEESVNFTTNCLPKDKKTNAELLIFFSHHFRRDTELYNSIKNKMPIIPVVCPMRDPLLHLNTKLFWTNRYNDDRLRKQQSDAAINRFTEILSLPDKHRFLFPVDIYSTKTTKEERTKLCKDLFEFCNIEQTERTIEFNNLWEPAHQTKEKSRSERKYKFLNNKEAIINKDIDYLETNMDIELKKLREAKDLKDKLRRYGYTDLVWW